MKRLCATVAALALSGGLALAQSSGGASTGGATSSPASPAAPGASTTGPTSPTGPSPASPPAPSDSSTTGRAPGVNPANSQDVSRRGNPQDLTLPTGKNPQDSTAPGTPQIYKPER